MYCEAPAPGKGPRWSLLSASLTESISSKFNEDKSILNISQLLVKGKQNNQSTFLWNELPTVGNGSHGLSLVERWLIWDSKFTKYIVTLFRES